MFKHYETPVSPTGEGTENKLHDFALRDTERGVAENIVAINIAAEAENVRRNKRCMAGLDALVLGGGLPWGVSFGYERTAKPGYPVINPTQAKAVRRAFELGTMLCAKRAALVLQAEKHLCPNGTVKWTTRMVRSIWNCVTYTGRIQYRKKQTHRSFTGKRISKVRRPEDQIMGYNASLAIVSEKQFHAVNEAMRLHQLAGKMDMTG